MNTSKPIYLTLNSLNNTNIYYSVGYDFYSAEGTNQMFYNNTLIVYYPMKVFLLAKAMAGPRDGTFNISFVNDEPPLIEDVSGNNTDNITVVNNTLVITEVIYINETSNSTDDSITYVISGDDSLSLEVQILLIAIGVTVFLTIVCILLTTIICFKYKKSKIKIEMKERYSWMAEVEKEKMQQLNRTNLADYSADPMFYAGYYGAAGKLGISKGDDPEENDGKLRVPDMHQISMKKLSPTFPGLQKMLPVDR